MKPEVGKIYVFYDDGKVGESRQHLAMVTRIIPFDSKELDRKIAGMPIGYGEEREKDYGERFVFFHSIKQYWQDATKNIDWVFAENTDFIIECAIPSYDEHLIYFAKTKHDGWFSFNIENSMQGGALDIENFNDKYLREDLKEKLNKNIL